MPMVKLILDSCTLPGSPHLNKDYEAQLEMQLAQTNHKQCGNGIKREIKTSQPTRDIPC